MGCDQGGGRQDGHLLDPRLVQAEDADEACNKGWQEGDLRQDDDGEGEAGEEDRQGFPVVCPQEEHLSRDRGNMIWAREPVPPPSAASRGRSAEAAKAGPERGEMLSGHTPCTP